MCNRVKPTLHYTCVIQHYTCVMDPRSDPAGLAVPAPPDRARTRTTHRDLIVHLNIYSTCTPQNRRTVHSTTTCSQHSAAGAAASQTYLISDNYLTLLCTVEMHRRRPYIDCGILFRLICRPLQSLFRPGREAYLGRRRPSAPPPSPHRPPGCASACQWS